MKMNYFETHVREDGTPYLAKEPRTIMFDARKRYDSPEKISELAKETGCTELAQESLFAAYFNTKNSLIGISRLTTGSVSASFVDVRSLLQQALLCGATNFAIWHNHPSGDPEPSSLDIMVTKKINEAAKIVELNFIDHIVIGRHGYSSMRELDVL